MFSEDDKSFIVNYYADFGSQFCADALGFTVKQIYTKARSLGIKVKTEVRSQQSRIYASRPRPELCKVPAEPFINITTPEHAYILGFLWADGHLSKNIPKISFSFSHEDYDGIIDTFNKTGAWCYYATNPQNRKRQANLRIHNRALYEYLKQLDYIEKSYASAIKAYEAIPDKFKKYWLRGYFDGDGCFFNANNRAQYRFQFAGSYDTDWTLHERILTELEIKYSVKKRLSKKGHKSSTITCFNREGVIKLGNFIYSDYDNIGFKRKYNQYISILEAPRRCGENRHGYSNIEKTIQ